MDDLTWIAPYEAALRPLEAGLTADGYSLNIAAAPHRVLDVSVAATEAACAECLVPRSLFERMVRAQIEMAGLAVPDGLSVSYPVGHPDQAGDD